MGTDKQHRRSITVTFFNFISWGKKVSLDKNVQVLGLSPHQKKNFKQVQFLGQDMDNFGIWSYN